MILCLKTLLAIVKVGVGGYIFHSAKIFWFLPAYARPNAVLIALHDKFGHKDFQDARQYLEGRKCHPKRNARGIYFCHTSPEHDIFFQVLVLG